MPLEYEVHTAQAAAADGHGDGGGIGEKNFIAQ